MITHDKSFIYHVSSLVYLTGAQLQTMKQCAEEHWDANLRAFFRGPIGSCWENSFHKEHLTTFAGSPDKVITIEMSRDDVTLCLAIVDSWSGVPPIWGRVELQKRLAVIWDQNEAERLRING